MKIYSGELKDGMPCRHMVRSYEGIDVGYEYYAYGDAEYPNAPDEIYVLNKETGKGEWQLYKPQTKKVWGIPAKGERYYTGYDFVIECESSRNMTEPQWLSRKHAEQHAKALNMANEFRLLSDVPVDGVEQFYIRWDGNVDDWSKNRSKLSNAIFGVVFNTREQAEQALAKFPQIHIANKIIQFGFHGIVEERL